jgi:hypothetical protein
MGRPRKEDKLTPAEKMKRYRRKKALQEKKRRIDFYLPMADEKGKGYPGISLETLMEGLRAEATELTFDKKTYRHFFYASILHAARVIKQSVMKEMERAQKVDEEEKDRASNDK